MLWFFGLSLEFDSVPVIKLKTAVVKVVPRQLAGYYVFSEMDME